ncbi:MAG: ABC transporter ATP-binding protein [Burkholderiales bacterium]|uniref:ABC transporter ATP-binding protein n=1 Tax=Pandoraea thiooxydans TaxID=445709 RepID=A0A0G3EKF9_9BURK|nr:ABC transporter ATP-binding protein [Pandoraea thiooxydans]AKJ67513.1 ABC transporter ATP-binding protein [Pandoraea thiooxydans]APR94573.1 ABC transporter ATP-binding component (tauB-like) protein [Pandoraea thiooxydans]MDE2290106.1 ABC transporter ATP-binding protein [Burkholderiales bacterium]
MAYVQIDDVSKVFTDARRGTELLTLDRISLHLEQREFLCLLGPSGCGKSTLLNMIAGFESASSGRVSVGGRQVDQPGANRGMVFQQATLMPWLTVWENVAFYHKLQGRGKRERRELAQAYIDLVGLTGFENHYPSELSGGMSQRVGIARALLLNPDVILMDEPFAALDAQTKEELQQELVTIWQKSQATIVFVTHSVDEALLLGTQVAVMTHRPGRIRELIGVDLPRPRDVTSPRFNDLKRHVLGLIREEACAANRLARAL